ncbi:MAG: mandelate racemase/muconate lactonizing enzyme family protein [Aquisalimonadaceae bacterium]
MLADQPLAISDTLLPQTSDLPLSGPVRIRRVDTYVHRAPIARPVLTSFGEMRDRPAVLIRVEDHDGAHGWGEVWCNYPACGAEHRARLLDSVIAPRLIGARYDNVPEATRDLEASVRVLAIQTAEWGPLAQVLAGLDIALWDLSARRANTPLARLLGASGSRISVPAYASGINPEDAAQTIRAFRQAGYGAFKIKVGFGLERDTRALSAARDELSAGERLMIDANQAWNLDTALEMSRVLAEFSPQWLEEPMTADTGLADWHRLAADSPIPIAGGENLRGVEAFSRAMDSGVMQVIQPDMCKWGGVTGCLPVARAIRASGKLYCPHFLGAGIGLMASAQLLAAVGGDGLLEVDSNPNPLRQSLATPFPELDGNGCFTIPQQPGLGVEPDLNASRQWQVAHYHCTGG